MIEALVNVLMFFLGLLVGAGMFIGYGFYQVKKIKNVKDLLIDEIKKKVTAEDDKRNSIKERLIQAAKIAQVQMELRAQAEMPSKNAAHSKYKNGLVAEINDMEQQKLDILRTVLAEGFDPMITVLHDGGTREEIPLSAYVATAQTTADGGTGKKDATPPPHPGMDQPPRKVGKFFIYKGGKDDGTTH
jgi:hypothetical protein